LLLNQGVDGRTRVLRQTDWEAFVPPFWRPDPDDTSSPEEPQSVPVEPAPSDNAGVPPVVDGNGSLLGCNCPAPPQFNPVCGNDGVTYGNLQKLNCARSCGRNVRLSFIGACRNG
ncbi:hypothetical protein Cfor_05117, partial [Coptotermes formosanus]